ncbi:MAG: hypothetical protein WB441_05530 [Nocardioidaceae bacterium]
MRASRPFVSATAVTAACAAVLALGGAPAGAAVPDQDTVSGFTVLDARHDVVRGSTESSRVPARPAPRRRQGDVVALTATHGGDRVRVTMRYAELDRLPGALTVHTFAFRTDAGRFAELGLLAHDGNWAGEPVWTVRGRESEPCAGLRTAIDYRRNTVRVVVPRDCLSDPRWVRVGGGGGSLVGSTLFADDALRAGSIGHDLRLGPRLQH